MDKKVEELVERVAQKLYDQYRGVDGKYIKNKQLSPTNRDSWKDFYIRALEVCQLFEPKPIETFRILKETEHPEEFTKPDESRLLTEIQLSDAIQAGNRMWAEQTDIDNRIPLAECHDIKIREYQDAKTASIKEAECQQRVERIFREMETCFGAPAGHPQAKDWGVAIYNGDWLALKKLEGVE